MPTPQTRTGMLPNAPFLQRQRIRPAESYLPKYISPYNYKTTDRNNYTWSPQSKKSHKYTPP